MELNTLNPGKAAKGKSRKRIGRGPGSEGRSRRFRRRPDADSPSYPEARLQARWC